MLVSGADAMERLMTAYKEIVELAGYTARVAVMIQVFEDCSDSKYQRQAVAGAPSKGVTNETQFSIEFQDGMPVSKGVVTESTDGTIHLENVGNMIFWLFMSRIGLDLAILSRDQSAEDSIHKLINSVIWDKGKTLPSSSNVLLTWF